LPYRIHPQKRYALLIELRDLFRSIPHEEQPKLLAEIDEMYYSQEYGNPELSRDNSEGGPYWFEHQLIRKADELIARGKPLRACQYCLAESCGEQYVFVSQTQRVYCRPKDATEREVSEDLRRMLIRIAEALITQNPLRSEKSGEGDELLSIVCLRDMLFLLGAHVPTHLVTELKRQMNERSAAEPKNPELYRLQDSIRERFGA
jgi:hypothetical protein